MSEGSCQSNQIVIYRVRKGGLEERESKRSPYYIRHCPLSGTLLPSLSFSSSLLRLQPYPTRMIDNLTYCDYCFFFSEKPVLSHEFMIQNFEYLCCTRDSYIYSQILDWDETKKMVLGLGVLEYIFIAHQAVFTK